MKKTLLCLLILCYTMTAPAQSDYRSVLDEILQRGYKESKQNLLGVTIPSFQVTTYAGERIISDELKGKVVVLHFWMMTCPVCMDQLNGLNQLVRQFEHNGEVEFLSFTTETVQFLEDDFFPNYSLLFKIVPDYHQFLGTDFLVPWGFPVSMVVDRQGKIHSVFSMRDWEGEDWPVEISDKLGSSINACLE
ncbi:MAG: TlpA disulfide reductase family protein [Saprospiraceae bacterium]|nr:TlpA family protein disulfide reductase [Lewinella sp.]